MTMDEMLAVGFAESVERLSAAAAALELVVERLSGSLPEKLAAAADETVGRIVATVESARQAELERKLAEAEQTIVELRAPSGGGRKTVVAGSLLAKAGEASEL